MRTEQWMNIVRPRVVVITFFLAWVLSFMTVRRTIWLDWMALALLFWAVYQPKRVSLVLAFVLGILVDVQQSSRMGEHALMYLWLVYVMRLIAPRLQFASVFMHALYAVGLIALAQLIRNAAYFVFAGSWARMTDMVWLVLAIPLWLLFVWLLTGAAQSRGMGTWLTK